jgi:hypothetical protein
MQKIVITFISTTKSCIVSEVTEISMRLENAFGKKKNNNFKKS